MNYTQNYQLNQWEAADRVQRTDFNADNAKLDAAIQAQADALAAERSVREAADQSIRMSLVKLAAGSYTGDGADSRTIYLGFTPKAVLLMLPDGKNGDEFSCYGGFAVQDSPAIYTITYLEIVENGFRLTQGYREGRYNYPNHQGIKYLSLIHI